MTILKRKTLVANQELYNVVVGQHGNGSIAFLADLPKNAIVTNVLVNGKSLEDYRLEAFSELGEKLLTIYPKNSTFEGTRIVAEFISETCGDELYNLAALHCIESFVVEYIETALAEV